MSLSIIDTAQQDKEPPMYLLTVAGSSRNEHTQVFHIMTVKPSALSLAQSHGHEKESTSTTKDLLKHNNISTAPIAEISDQAPPCSNELNDDQNYKHLSAAGEHFARKKSEGEHTTLFRRLVARIGHPEGRDELQDGEQVVVMDDEEAPAPVEDPYKHFSAAGEHFAKKKAEKKLHKATKKMGKEESTAVEIGEEDLYRHLSAAGEHFAKKKAGKKSLKSPKKKELVGEEESAENQASVENGTEVDNEVDCYKHLSAAGEHFARRKSDGESPSLFRRMSSSFAAAGRSNSTTTEDWDEDEAESDRFKHLSSAGEHFARKKAEKKARRRASWVNKREHPSKREEEEEEEEELTEKYDLEPSSNSSLNSCNLNVVSPKESSEEVPGPGACVPELLITDTSNDKKDINGHAMDTLEQANEMVAQQSEDGGVKTTLAAEEDEEASQKEENNTQIIVPNTAALDKIQRTPAYTLHRDLVIGKGSYGHVYIASRGEAEGYFSSKPGKRKKFACKCVSLPADPKHICKLQEEVNVLRVLRGHANVIRLYDVFVLDNELLVITELGTGGDLFHLLATHPKHGVSEEYAGKIHIIIVYCSECVSS